MNKEDYIFLKYIDRFFNNRFLSILINEYERGISLLERRKIKDYVDDKPKLEDAENILFLYILFKKTKENTHVHELEKTLAKRFNKLTLKEGRDLYKKLKGVLNILELDEPTVSPDVIKNVRQYIIY